MGWYFTIHGLYAVVAGRFQSGPKVGQIDASTIMVRARSKEHLANLRKAHKDLLRAHSVKSTTDTDYPFRLILPRAVWLKLGARLAAEVSYPNFKQAVAERAANSEHDYADLLHEVWHAGYRFQTRATAKTGSGSDRQIRRQIVLDRPDTQFDP